MGVMQLFIPSMNRANKQTTIRNLPPAWLRRTALVVPKDQLAAYKPWSNVVTIISVPLSVKGIGDTRHFIMTKLSSTDKLCMLDDDLRFDVRRKDDQSKFSHATMQDTANMLEALERALTPKTPHGSIMCREGANRLFEDQQCVRMLRMLAYHVPTYRALKIDYGKLCIMEDFATTLALLCKGKPNTVLCGWTQDQAQSGAPGGCSTYRTLEMQAEAAHELRRLYPDFVKVVEKTTKTSWGKGGATRTDVQIAWKKAYFSSGAIL